VLKFIFWSLLCLNGVLLAYSQGALGHFNGNEREPARMKNQLNTDKLRLLPGAPVAAAPKPAELTACIEIGDFSAAEARRFEAKLAPLQLGERQARHSLAAAEATSHIVFIASQGSKEAAERKARELKNLGVTDYFIVSDNSALKWGISLGVFKSEAAAQALLAGLVKQGVHSARLAARGAQATRLAFQFRAVDAATRSAIGELAGSAPALETRSCK
jgi:hypothetical protein